MRETNKILAIFAVSICAAVVVLVFNSPNEGSKADAANPHYCDAKLASFGLRIGAEADQSDREREKADLCQQIVMAEAAKETALYSKLQLYATIFGVVVAGFIAWRAYGVARKALFDLERPHVFVDVVTSGTTSHGIVLGTGKKFKYRLVNYGRTPAQLIDLLRRYPVIARPDMPPAISPSDNDGDYWVYADGVIVASDRPHEESDHDLFTLYGGALMDEKAMRKDRLFFYGRARYADIFRDRYIIGFCFVFDPIGGKFVRWGDKEYNYTRKE